jgi:transketolase C-terminal domain/subunit
MRRTFGPDRACQVRELITALVTKSANDAAVVVAEGGAFTTRRAALHAARTAAVTLPGVQRVEVTRPRGSRLYRGRLASFTAAEARAAYVRLHRRGIGCTPVARR